MRRSNTTNTTMKSEHVHYYNISVYYNSLATAVLIIAVFRDCFLPDYPMYVCSWNGTGLKSKDCLISGSCVPTFFAWGVYRDRIIG